MCLFREDFHLHFLKLPLHGGCGGGVVARSPLTPPRAPRPLLTASLSEPSQQERERAGKWLHQHLQTRCAGYIRQHQPRRRRREERGEHIRKLWREECQKKWDNIAGGWSGGEERRCWRCCWSSIKKCTHSAACRTRCQKGKFGTDRCSCGGGWAHLLQPQRNRVNEFSFGQSNKEHCQPSDFSSSRMKFWRRGKCINISEIQIYTEQPGFLPCRIQ